MQTLRPRELLALGFLTFALFLGAGNIIFPPMVGLAAGEHFWSAALGFLLTGVGLPLLTVVALARVGGGMEAITAPLGRWPGMLLGIAVYLTIGPMFATPRTATVSFEMGLAPFVGNGPGALLAYSAAYFGLVLLLALFPGKLMDTLGRLITPVLLVALAVLGGAAFVLPAGSLLPSAGDYQQAALAEGFLQGYQTMDALAALVFGIVIVNAIKDTGVTDSGLHTRYAIVAGLIAAVGLCLVYVSLMYLGAHSGSLVSADGNGVQILTRYVQHTFGTPGMLLLSSVIVLACLTTGVGLVSACASYFSALVPGSSYRGMVVALSLVSMLIANQGLEQLIAVAVPVLVAIYPMAIALVALSLLSPAWKSAPRVFMPVMLVALAFGLLDAAQALDLAAWAPGWLERLPGSAMGLGWLLPVAATLLACGLLDRMQPVRCRN